MTKLSDGNLLALLPASISDDPQMRAAAEALAPVLKALSLSIPNLLIFSRLGKQPPDAMSPPLARLTQARGGLKPLSLDELEQLAWQFHVDFREVCTTRDQLAAMVRNSIPWHRIKGTPASIKAALSLCGYSGISIEEDGTGDDWAAYQLGLSEITGLDDVRRIVTICREMQPVRCRLWRMYTPEYDFRPGVWSGPLPTCAWSECWWSNYSGVEVPGKFVKDLNAFDINNLRWNKVILCTDADVDGFQIRTLILTMIYRLCPTLIREGYVYIAETPLFEITCGEKTWFAYTDKEKNDIVKTLEGKRYKVDRSKGLGQNDPEMMWLTTMNPETRRLIKVMPEDAEATAHSFDLLLGDNLQGRKDHIAENGYKYLEMIDVS